MVLTKKHKGNTLPEILIAIVIITFTSAIGVTIYLNIQQNTQPFIKLKAAELAHKYLMESEESNDLFDKDYKEEEFIIKKKVTRVSNFPDCIQITVSVSNKQEKKISELQKILYAN